MVRMETGWYCSACGGLAPDELRQYGDDMYNTHSKCFGPWCSRCGQRAAFRSVRDCVVNGRISTTNASVLVLTGTCASGKSFVSYELWTYPDR